jgi:hypothetical protein
MSFASLQLFIARHILSSAVVPPRRDLAQSGGYCGPVTSLHHGPLLALDSSPSIPTHQLQHPLPIIAYGHEQSFIWNPYLLQTLGADKRLSRSRWEFLPTRGLD